MDNLKNAEQLQPRLLWKNFDKVLGCPHPSNHSELLSDLVSEFGKKLGLETLRDEARNVVIRKGATTSEMAKKGMVTIQAHLDMVPQKAEGKLHDFTKDALKAYVDGPSVKAEGTTLGADNGIGVAAIMALLESNEIEHGPIEAFFTVDEETCMDGANFLKNDLLKGRYLINTDSEEEGEICIGCAGGLDVKASFEYKKVDTPVNHIAYRLTVSGLKGGHSGSNIHEGRGNAIKILARLLFLTRQSVSFYLSELNGGTLRNVIPSKAEAIVLIKKEDDKRFKDIISDFSVMIKREYKLGAPLICITLKEAASPLFVLDKKISSSLIDSIHCCADAVFRMDDSLPIVQTSSNLGVINTLEKCIEIRILARSLMDTARDNAGSMVGTTFSLAGAEVEYFGGYPGWKPDVSSRLLKVAKDSYRELFEKEAKVLAIHAGLECGIISSKYPKMEMISIGPTIKEAHSINERVEVKSVEKFFDYLCKILKEID